MQGEDNAPVIEAGNAGVQPAATRLPALKLSLICLVFFCEGFNANALFAFVGYMVRDFNIATKETEVGYYAGLIASSFFLCQFLSGFLWGRLSDRIGRRPVILVGLFGTLVSSLMFGFSKSLLYAILTRSVNGLLNGNIGVAKTYLGEVTDKSNQAQAMAFFSLAWNVGTIVGPIAGGFLSQPTLKYDGFEGQGFLHEYPFLLPSALTAAITGITFVLCFFFMKETLPRRGYQKEYAPLIPSKHFESEPIKNPVKEDQKISSILKDEVAMMCALSHALLASSIVIYFEVFPLWAILPTRDGGLGFSTSDIGIVLSIGGVYTVIFQTLTYRRIVARFGIRKIFVAVQLLSVPVVWLMPELHQIAPSPGPATAKMVFFWMILVVFNALVSKFNSIAFSAVNTMLNNSVSFHKMGAVNGVSMSLSALFRAFAPSIGATLLAWSSGENINYLISFRFAFMFICVLYVISAIICYKLPERINEPLK